MVVVKVNDDPRGLASTAQNMATLARLEIPVPTVLGTTTANGTCPEQCW
jgi:hypothetical protein